MLLAGDPNMYYKKVYLEVCNYRVSVATEKVTGCFRSGAGNGVLPYSETPSKIYYKSLNEITVNATSKTRCLLLKLTADVPL